MLAERGHGEGTQHIQSWPEESREAAQLVADQYGEPDEMIDGQLIWHQPGPWKRIVASKDFFQHDFQRRTRIGQSVFPVPTAKFSELAKFDGSIIVERTVP